jgi:hypothetical protein
MAWQDYDEIATHRASRGKAPRARGHPVGVGDAMRAAL